MPFARLPQPLPALFLPALCALFVGIAPEPVPAQNRRGIRIGRWQKRHVPEGWILLNSKSYQIQSQAGKDKAQRLANHMEAMLRVYKKLFPAGKSTNKKYPVKLFKNRRNFVSYSGKAGAGGYYSPVEREMVLFDTGKWSDEQEAATTGTPGKIDFEALKKRYNMDILGVASHEGWHQYFDWYVGSRVYLPSWVNEGMGDYFYTVTPKKVKGKKLAPQIGTLNQMRLPTIRAAVRANKHVPIAELIRYEQRDYYANPGVCYAEGWALCHFLLHSENKKYRELVPRFVKRFKNRGNWKKNTDLYFKKIDLVALEKEWKAWVLAQKVTSPLSEMLKRMREARKKGGERGPDKGDK